MAKRSGGVEMPNAASPGEREAEVRTAILEFVEKLLSGASTSGERNRLFPNGIGLVEVEATLDPPKFTLSARVADVQYPHAAPKAVERFEARLPQIAKVADDILSYCITLDQNDDPVMKDCNAFVKKVGKQFGVAIPDTNADGIVDAMTGPPFSKTTMDPAEAMRWASDGLVVAGMKLSELNPAYGTQYKNGHVAIVHATSDPSHPGFPMASWGKLGGRGQSNTSIRWSFPAAACDDNAIHFGYADTA